MNRSGVLLLVLLVVLMISPSAYAEPYLPQITIGLEEVEGPEQVSTGIQLLLLLTVLSLAPSILVLMTSFTRIIVVLSFVRSALATHQMPPNQVLVGLALFLTIFIMAPVWQAVYADAWIPYSEGQISQEEAFERAGEPVREFLLKHTREKDLALFLDYTGHEQVDNPEDIPLYVLVPAFAISELKTAFQIGFAIYLPFIIIDMVVASTLMSMGMLMLPPMMISLPFKVLLFVLVDGWHLVVKSLLLSFN